MKQGRNKQYKKSIEKKEENYSLKVKNGIKKKNYRTKGNGNARMTYKIYKYLLDGYQYITIFGENFVKRNKRKCKIIIENKEYELISKIGVDEFEKYGINP